MEEENHLTQDIGTFRYAGAQGGEVPGQLVKKCFFFNIIIIPESFGTIG